MNKKAIFNYIGMTLVGISALLILFCFSKCFSGDIWYDELFTMGFAGSDVASLVDMTARDVHPPLYYLIVKAGIAMMGILLPGLVPVVHAKIISVVAMVLWLVYALTLVKKRYGWLCSGLFMIALMTMPQISAFSTEIRMYTWAIAFVTATFLHSQEVLLLCDKQPHGRLCYVHMLAMVWWGICAAYTHYYACIAVAFVYIWMLLTMLVTKKVGTCLKLWIGGVIASCVLYLPWLMVLLRQISAVKANYWIQPLTLRSIGGCIKYMFKTSYESSIVNTGLAVLFFAFCVWLILDKGIALCKSKDAEDRLLLCGQLGGVFVLVMLVVTGFVASFLIRPVFIYRYMMPAFGCYWLSIAEMVSDPQGIIRCGKKEYVYVILLVVLFAVFGYKDMAAFNYDENYKAERMLETMQALDSIGPEDKVIFNFDQVQGILSYYIPNETYLWQWDPEVLIHEMYPTTGRVDDTDTIREWIASGKKVWFVGSGNARDELIALWQQDHIRATENYSVMLERYWFNLYSIELDD